MRAVLVTVGALLWAGFFWFEPLEDLPVYRQVKDLFVAVIPHKTARWTVTSAVLVVVPAAVVARLSPAHVAAIWARGRRGTLRVTIALYVVALPALIYLGTQPSMHRYYRGFFQSGGELKIFANTLMIVAEHIFIEGLVLGLALPRGVVSDRWLRVPRAAWPALIAATAVFGLVHTGKASVEVLSAFPGGLGLALLTLQSRAVWPSVALHLATGATIVGAIALSR